MVPGRARGGRPQIRRMHVVDPDGAVDKAAELGVAVPRLELDQQSIAGRPSTAGDGPQGADDGGRLLSFRVAAARIRRRHRFRRAGSSSGSKWRRTAPSRNPASSSGERGFVRRSRTAVPRAPVMPGGGNPLPWCAVSRGHVPHGRHVGAPAPRLRRDFSRNEQPELDPDPGKPDPLAPRLRARRDVVIPGEIPALHPPPVVHNGERCGGGVRLQADACGPGIQCICGDLGEDRLLERPGVRVPQVFEQVLKVDPRFPHGTILLRTPLWGHPLPDPQVPRSSSSCQGGQCQPANCELQSPRYNASI